LGRNVCQVDARVSGRCARVYYVCVRTCVRCARAYVWVWCLCRCLCLCIYTRGYVCLSDSVVSVATVSCPRANQSVGDRFFQEDLVDK
jgi:hypothetical protein